MFVKQKASVILTLAYILPSILGELFPVIDWYYCNFLGCMKITIAAFSPICRWNNSRGVGAVDVFLLYRISKTVPWIVYKAKNALHASSSSTNSEVWTFASPSIQWGLRLNIIGSRITDGKPLWIC